MKTRSLLAVSALVAVCSAPFASAAAGPRVDTAIYETFDAVDVVTLTVANAPELVGDTPHDDGTSGTAGSPDDVGEAVQRALGAVEGGNWKVLGGTLILLAVFIVRRFIAPKMRGGALIAVTIGIGALTALGTHFASDKPWNGFMGVLSVVIAGVMQSAIASGLFSWGKEIAKQKDAPAGAAAAPVR